MVMASETEKKKKKSSWETPAIEKKYVHGVYDAIAPHFSSTRHAKWPKVSLFLGNLPSGSLVLDAGCGNGKYLGLNPKCFFVGCDLSSPLVSICSQREGKRHEVMVADTLHLPYREMLFDGAISIAVLHHLSTEERRRKAVEEMARVVRRGGRILITVWAVEQEDKNLVCKWTPLSSRYVEEEWVGAGASASPLRPRTKISAPPLDRIDEHRIENTQDSLSSYNGDVIRDSSLLAHGICPIKGHPFIETHGLSCNDTTGGIREYGLPYQDAIRVAENCGISDQGVICAFGKHDISDQREADCSGSVGEDALRNNVSSNQGVMNAIENHGLSNPGVSNDVENHGLLNSGVNTCVNNHLLSDQGVMTPLHELQEQNISNDEVTEGSEPEDATEATNVEQQDFFVPWHLPFHRAEIGGASAAAVASGFARKDEKKAAVVYNRYYHVFAKGELERLVSDVYGVAVVEEFYDKSNWCVILERI